MKSLLVGPVWQGGQQLCMVCLTLCSTWSILGGQTGGGHTAAQSFLISGMKSRSPAKIIITICRCGLTLDYSTYADMAAGGD